MDTLMTARALTLHQPWASLVALGVKRLETRSWSTSYRGRLLIHAAARIPNPGPLAEGYGVGRDESGWFMETPRVGVVTNERGRVSLPLGAVVASCDLIVDVVPILADAPHGSLEVPAVVAPDSGGRLRWWRAYEPVDIGPGVKFGGWEGLDAEADRPFGDFSPGRFAWLLGDVKPTTERCPRCWGKGHVFGLDPAHPGDGNVALRCPTCEWRRRCEPVPMKGKQGLWTPTWEEAACT